MIFPLVDFRRTPGGHLRITLTTSGREWFPEIEIIRDHRGIDAAFVELIEYQLANGWELVRPEEIGALTDSLILSADVRRDDHGDLVRVGRIDWNPDYAVNDEIEVLEERGWIQFAGTE